MSEAPDQQSVLGLIHTALLTLIIMSAVCAFMTYEEDESGKDWVVCACGQWLHKDCADDCVVNKEGNERLCSICLNQFCM